MTDCSEEMAYKNGERQNFALDLIVYQQCIIKEKTGKRSRILDTPVFFVKF